MSTSAPEDEIALDSAEREAARALSQYLEARNGDPDSRPESFAPGDPQAANHFWNAVEGLGALMGDVEEHGGEQTDSPREADEDIPEEIGGYRILSVLGSGGMGTVYEAQQQHPRRPVALKVVRGGKLIDKRDVKLFQREVQTLARLKHPYIAAIYQSGRTDDGQHFFAMELVQGEPLTTYVEREKLSMRERLELFHKICDAINYAHQRSVIHRDLKPSNILIDTGGNPKVLDFGLAKITDVDMATTTLVTEPGKIQGTLAYMSPEQARGKSDEIDLRSDVYSLGVTLYELLTERLPYDVRNTVLHEAVRIICEEGPRRPGTISRTLRGDVETMALKALAKEPTWRYQSVSELAEDVHRYLTNQPILARHPSKVYEFRKLVARNKAPFAFVAALFVLVAGFGIWMSVLYTRAEQLRAETQQRADELKTVTEFQQSMLGGIDAYKMGRGIIDKLRQGIRKGLDKGETTSQEIEASIASFDQLAGEANATDLALNVVDEHVLSRAVKAIHKDFADQPQVRASLQQTVVDTYAEIGLYEPALHLQEASLRTRRRVLGGDHPDTLTSINSLGILIKLMGNHEESERFYVEALMGRRRVLGDDHPRTLDSISHMGSLLQAMGKYAEAETYFREALGDQRRVLGDNHPDTLLTISNMGILLQEIGKYEDANAYHRESLRGRRRVLGNDHPHTLTSINNMCAQLQFMGQLEEALHYCREVLDGSRRVRGDDHPGTLASIGNMGGLLQSMGRHDEAELYYLEALAGFRRVHGDDHSKTLISMNNLGVLLMEMGKYEEALTYHRETLDGRRRVLGADHPHTLISISNMGGLLNLMGKYAEAETYFREALETKRRVLGDDHLDTLISIHNMGGLMRDVGRLKEAEALGAEAVCGANANLAQSHPFRIAAICQYGITLAHVPKYSDAEGHLLEAHEGFITILGPNHQRTIKVINSLVDLYDAWHAAEPDKGYAAKAAEWRAKLPQPAAEAEAATP